MTYDEIVHFHGNEIPEGLQEDRKTGVCNNDERTTPSP